MTATVFAVHIGSHVNSHSLVVAHSSSYHLAHYRCTGGLRTGLLLLLLFPAFPDGAYSQNSPEPHRSDLLLIDSIKESLLANDIDSAERQIQRLKATTAKKALPVDLQIAIHGLAFKVATRRLLDARQGDRIATVNPQDLYYRTFQATFEDCANTLSRQMEIEAKLGGKGPMLVALAQLQQLHLEMSRILRQVGRFREAITHLAAARELYLTHQEDLDNEVTIYERGATSVTAKKLRRSETLGVLDLKKLAQERIDLSRLWNATNGDSTSASELSEAYGQYASEYATDPLAYYYLRRQMEMLGTLDIEKLRETLEACADKSHPKALSNAVSFANLLMESKQYHEAIAVYRDVLSRGGPGSGRLPELYAQLGEAYEFVGNKEEALNFYRMAQSISNQFAHLPSAIDRMRRGQAAGADATTRSESRDWLIRGNIALVVLLTGIMLWYVLWRRVRPQ